MKTNLILSISIFAIHLFGYSQDIDCIDGIRTGTFQYMAGNVPVILERTETEQIESYNNGKSKVFTKIRWISDTEYLITFIKQKNAKGCLKKGDEMKLTILECDGLTYKAILTSEHCGGAPITMTFTKIK